MLPSNASAREPFAAAAAAQRPSQTEMHAGPLLSQALNDDALMTAQEQTPAYRALHESGLISTQYRVRRVGDLQLVRGDWDMTSSVIAQGLTCNGCCCCVKFFVVNAGCVRKAVHRSGEYMFFGQGVHVLPSPYVNLVGRDIRLTDGAIIHGTKAIVTVTQGFVGYALDRGQPVLLPPGLHQWDSPTIEFVELIDLSSSIIRMGPYTLVTVDEGYAAVTQDNGQQRILEGGSTYMLTHRNWKFEKFMTKKLQTNDIGPIRVTTGDNVPLVATATVNWLVEDAAMTARMAANTMMQSGGGRVVPGATNSDFDINQVREDVTRQVTASLAAFIGTVRYAVHGHGGMAMKVEGEKTQGEEPEEEIDGRKALFDKTQLANSVDHANEVCRRYGVRILSINLISAQPADQGLLDALSQGAVATVGAEQAETKARGEAQAILLKARAEADATRIRAQGDAEADEIRAEGSIRAAAKLERSQVAVEIAKIKQAGESLKEGKANSFFFGLQGAADVPAGLLGTALLSKA